jgi:DNA-binding NarL/FixJ family response regulator
MLLREVIATSDELEATFFHTDRLADAISIAENNEIDVAITDLSLPDSFGLETFSSFHRRQPSIPTIILSGRKDHDLAFQAIKAGAQDYLFKGEPSQTAIIRTIRFAIERQRLITELQQALSHVKQLQGLLPICAHCKNIRDDKGYWNRIENYIASHSEAEFSHSICPDCARKHYPDIFID